MPSSLKGSHSLTLITTGGNPSTSVFVANEGHANGSRLETPRCHRPFARDYCANRAMMPFFSIDEGFPGKGHCAGNVRA